MSYNRECPFTTTFGTRYILIFSEFENGHDFNIPVIDISLTCEDDLERANDIDVLIYVNQLIKKYVSDFKNVVLYYYCDSAPIFKSLKNDYLSNQEYRQVLFDRMFEYARFKSIIKKSIIIEDLKQGNHYINLISHINMKNNIDDIAKEMNELHK